MDVAQTVVVVGYIPTAEENDNIVSNTGNSNKYIVKVQSMVLGIDDNNKPAPENVPTPESR